MQYLIERTCWYVLVLQSADSCVHYSQLRVTHVSHVWEFRVDQYPGSSGTKWGRAKQRHILVRLLRLDLPSSWWVMMGLSNGSVYSLLVNCFRCIGLYLDLLHAASSLFLSPHYLPLFQQPIFYLPFCVLPVGFMFLQMGKKASFQYLH